MLEIVPCRECWPEEFRQNASRLREELRDLARHLTEPAAYREVKDPAVDLIHLAAGEWAASTGWQPGPPDT